MESLYIFSNGTLERKNNTLAFVNQDGKRKYIPVENVSEMHIFGEVNFNKRALEFLTEKNIILHMYNYFGYYIGSFYPREHYNSAFVIIKQTEKYLKESERLKLAKKFIEGAYKNILRNISDYSRKEPKLIDIASGIKSMAKELNKAKSVDEIMGIEANIRQAYYDCFSYIISNKDFRFEKRTKRPPADPINALISFGNSLVYTTTLSQIYETHLDPRIGYLHTNNHRRFTLNLDISEIFKPIIADRIIFSLLNKGQIRKKHFLREMNRAFLNEEGKKIFVEEFNKRLESTVYRPQMKRNVSYRTLIRLEVYKLEKHIIDDKEYKPYVRS